MILMDNPNNSSEQKDDKQSNISFLPTEKRYIMVTDETGNIKGCFPLKPKNLGKGWIALYQNPSIWIAQQRLTGEQYSVMHVLFGKLDSELLDMQVTHVSRAMKKLKELEIIIEGPPAGKFKTYRLNPYIAHKGSNVSDTIIDFDAITKEKTK